METPRSPLPKDITQKLYENSFFSKDQFLECLEAMDNYRKVIITKLNPTQVKFYDSLIKLREIHVLSEEMANEKYPNLDGFLCESYKAM